MGPTQGTRHRKEVNLLQKILIIFHQCYLLVFSQEIFIYKFHITAIFQYNFYNLIHCIFYVRKISSWLRHFINHIFLASVLCCHHIIFFHHQQLALMIHRFTPYFGNTNSQSFFPGRLFQPVQYRYLFFNFSSAK